MIHQVVKSDVTDLGRSLVCVAGFDAGTGRQMRLTRPSLSSPLLDRMGGLLPGSIVEVDWTAYRRPRAPHVEDGEWVEDTLAKRGQMAESLLIEVLSAKAFEGVIDAFGKPAEYGRAGNAAYVPGKGVRSLATVKAADIAISVEAKKVRVDFIDGRGDQWCAVPLQDLAVKRHRDNCLACARQFEKMLRWEFEGSGGLLRIGLAREWQGGCWLQVNAICLGKRHHSVPLTVLS